MPVAPVPLRECLLSLDDVSVTRGGTPIIHDITFQLQAGEIITVIGPNGAGKSTLIKTALGIIQPDSGSVTRHGDPVIGYVPQSVALDPALPLSVDRFLRLGAAPSPEQRKSLLELAPTSGARPCTTSPVASYGASCWHGR